MSASCARARARHAALAVGVAIAACGSPSFAPASRVDTLRVLAVRADQPFARPGEGVHVTALVADGHAPRAVAFAWGVCVNPGSEEADACARGASTFTFGGPTFDVQVPGDALATRPAGSPVGMVGVVFAACAGTLLQVRTETSPVRCVGPDGADLGRDGFVWGIKRIVVTESARNANPSIDLLRIDGVEWGTGTAVFVACPASSLRDCARDQRHLVEAIPSPTSVETALGVTEDLVASFYVSQGSVDDDYARVDPASGAFHTVVAATEGDPKRSMTMWIVLRDDRGGVTWAARSIEVR